LAEHSYGPAGGAELADEQIQQSAFAGAVGSQQSPGTGGELQGHVVDAEHGAVKFRDVFEFNHPGHGLSLLRLSDLQRRTDAAMQHCQ
jgi:hypothetical protein